jgi:hypothetical protein
LSGWLVTRATKSKCWGSMTSFAIFCMIFGQEIYTWMHYEYLCSNAGIRIYKTSPTEGFFYDPNDETFFRGTAKFFLSHHGYMYIEARGFYRRGVSSNKTWQA